MTSHDTPDEESLTADTQVQCTGGRPPRPNQETTVSNTASAPLYPPLYGASFGQAIAEPHGIA
ncbi:MAG: hypothetical protein J0I66_00560, partial [Microbacterium sp.]|nr:hypothetical protein [Microbacterium sp.]